MHKRKRTRKKKKEKKPNQEKHGPPAHKHQRQRHSPPVYTRRRHNAKEARTKQDGFERYRAKEKEEKKRIRHHSVPSTSHQRRIADLVLIHVPSLTILSPLVSCSPHLFFSSSIASFHHLFLCLLPLPSPTIVFLSHLIHLFLFHLPL